MTYGEGAFRSVARRLLCLILLGAIDCAYAQTPDHTEAVPLNLEQSSIRQGACTPVAETFLGWPANTIHRCEYQHGNATGLAYLLEVKAETMAKWIETSCAAQIGRAHV